MKGINKVYKTTYGHREDEIQKMWVLIKDYETLFKKHTKNEWNRYDLLFEHADTWLLVQKNKLTSAWNHMTTHTKGSIKHIEVHRSTYKKKYSEEQMKVHHPEYLL